MPKGTHPAYTVKKQDTTGHSETKDGATRKVYGPSGERTKDKAKVYSKKDQELYTKANK